MYGEQLYARYCLALKNRWPKDHAAPHVAIFGRPIAPAEPKSWWFLTKVERDAWDNLADELEGRADA